MPGSLLRTMHCLTVVVVVMVVVHLSQRPAQGTSQQTARGKQRCRTQLQGLLCSRRQWRQSRRQWRR